MKQLSTSAIGIEIIKNFEGYKQFSYICAGGYKTIGYGHRLLKNELFNNGLSLIEAEQILENDIKKCEGAVLKYINSELNNNQFDALVSFTFNLGAASLQRSTLRQKINYHLYQEAANEFPKWIYAGGRKMRGLIIRRQCERELFMK